VRVCRRTAHLERLGAMRCCVHCEERRKNFSAPLSSFLRRARKLPYSCKHAALLGLICAHRSKSCR
jgi:hypothetical protein